MHTGIVCKFCEVAAISATVTFLLVLKPLPCMCSLAFLKTALEEAAQPSHFVHLAYGRAGGCPEQEFGHPACLCHEIFFNPSPVYAAGSRQGMWKAEAAEAGIPTNMFSIRTNAAQGKRRTYGGTMVALAEYGSFGVEFWALSNCTGNPVYAETAERIYR